MNSAQRHGFGSLHFARTSRRFPTAPAALGLAAAALATFLLAPGATGADLSVPLLSVSEGAAHTGSGPARSLLSAAVRVGDPRSATATAPAVTAREWQVPLAFEPADDRAPTDADYAARGPGYAVFVGGGGALLVLQPSGGAGTGEGDNSADAAPGRHHADRSAPASSRWVRLRWEGASADANVVAEDPLPGRIHRLRGADSRQWQTGLQPHGRVRYRGVYPGVDVTFYGHGRQLEYDVVVAPGASAEAAKLRFDGVRSVKVDAEGGLRLDTGAGELVQRRPVAYQDGPRGRRLVDVAYRVEADGAVGFTVGEHDSRRPLVIDPVLGYSTFLGGTGFDQCWDVAVNAAGSAFVTGETESASYTHLRILSTNTFLPRYQGGLANVAGDAFVAKLTPDGTAVEWFTYLGGNDLESGFTISLASGDEPVVGGFSASTNFPVTASAYQSNFPGLTNKYTGRAPLQGFVSRLKSDGSGLVASTLFGAEGEEQVIDLALLPDESVVVVGTTTSTNFVTTAGAAQRQYGGATDAFIALFDAGLTTLKAASFLGGGGRDSAEGVAVAAGLGVAHVTGITSSTNLPIKAALQPTIGGLSDVWVAGFSLADLSTTYATYLGGLSDDYGYRAALAADGGVWIVGRTLSTNFPVVASLQATNAGGADGIIARLSGDGQSLLSSTYFGGTFDDQIWDVAVDGTGGLHFAGESTSTAIPGLSTNSLQSTNAGLADIFIGRLAADGTLTSTYFGSVGDELGYGIAVDPAGGVYVTGRARSLVFPISSTNVAQATFGGDRADGFVVKLAPDPTLGATLTANGVEVSWPGPNPGYVLESATLEAGRREWARETSPATLTAGRYVVRLPQSATNSVFRLRWER